MKIEELLERIKNPDDIPSVKKAYEFALEHLQDKKRKVWWKYKKCGNSWEAIISNRAKGSGCPICASKNAHNRAVCGRLCARRSRAPGRRV